MEKYYETCPVCGEKSSILIQHLINGDINHTKYLEEKLIPKIDKYLLETDLYFDQINEKLIKENFPSCITLIHQRNKTICPSRGYELQIETNEYLYDNDIKRKEPRIKIDINKAKIWKYGTKENSNNMIVKRGKLNPLFNVYSFIGNSYLQLYKLYHGENLICSYNGCKNNDTNVYHLDGDKNNFLLTNLDSYCNFHYNDMNYGSRKTPFVSITKRFNFESSHNLLNYNGKCSQLHGHSYILEITVKKRIDMKTEMVMDFGDLKKIVNKFVIDNLDHKYINNVIPYLNPTAENMVYWIWEILEKEALLKGLSKIDLWETKDSYVTLTKEDMLNSPLYVFKYYEEMNNRYKFEE